MRMADLGRAGVLAGLYVAAARVGLSLDAVHGFAAAVWPPTGLALAALVLSGVCLWPGIGVGAFLVNWWSGAPVLVAGGMALGNTLEAFMGWVLLTRVVGVRPALDRLRDVLGVLVLAAGLSTLVSATVGVTSGWLGGVIPPGDYGKAWRIWWLGNAMGVLVVTPLCFVWSARGRSTWPRRGRTEVLALLVVLSVVSVAVFGTRLDPALINVSYLVFPPLIWAAVRLGPRGAATATALVVASAIWGTAQGRGPFAEPTLHEGLVQLQTFMGVVAGTILLLAAVTAERWRAAAEVERRRQETALLAEIAQRLSASLNLDTVLQRVVTGAQALCGSERVFLALRAPGSDTLVGRYEVGAPEMAYAGLRIEPGKGLGGQVLRTGQPWRTEDYASDPRFSKEYLAGARAAGHLAVLAVPIVIDARVEGLLYASNHASRPFTDQDEAILGRLAVHAALAIQNAQLYHQAQAELAERQKAEAALAQAAATLEQRVQERTAALHQAMAEQQRLEREAQRVQHFALLGRLAAGVSHEIRNPLATVFLQVDLLEEELRTPSPNRPAAVTEALADIKTNLARLDDLVQDYLTLARVPNLQREDQDLGAAVQAWGTEMQHEVGRQGVTLQMHGLAGLGRVAFHASTLRRALLNLVQNAAEAIPQGGVVLLSGQSTATQVQLRVQDTGSGIPAEHLGRIFEPLYTTKPGGTGLGLYIVQEIVAAHDGQIRVESAVGQGTTFTLTLPRMPRHTPPAGAAGSGGAAPV